MIKNFQIYIFNFSGMSTFYYLWVVYRQKRFWPLWRNGVKPPHCIGTFMLMSSDSNSWISSKLQDKRPLAWSKFYLYDTHCFFTSIGIYILLLIIKVEYVPFMPPHILCLILIGMERKRIWIFQLEIGTFEKFFHSR